jgi:hypothetical protein
MESCTEMISDFVLMSKVNKHAKGDTAFPVKIPSKRKWIKDKMMYPYGLFSE